MQVASRRGAGTHAAKRQEARRLFELADELGSSLDLDETLSGLDSRLKRLIHYDGMAVYLFREGLLVPVYASGDDSQLFSALEIPIGQGLSGRVAESRKAVVNGDPAAEVSSRTNSPRRSALRSALAVPLENRGELTGVLTLYQAQPAGFGPDDLRLLLALRAKVARSIGNALKFARAERLATVDWLTSLPNSRALFLRLDAELARCRRNSAALDPRLKSMAVLVCGVEGLKPDHSLTIAAPKGVGRNLLQAIASGLRRICREDDYVARTGDEFVMVLSGFLPCHLADKHKLIVSLMDSLSMAEFGDHRLVARVGAAFYPLDGTDAEDLLAAAGTHRLGRPATGEFGHQLVELGEAIESPAAK